MIFQEKKILSSKIREAAELISDPKKWTRGCSARNAKNKKVDPDDPTATKWCALGALHTTRLVSYDGAVFDRAFEMLSPMVRNSPPMSIVNDKYASNANHMAFYLHFLAELMENP